jgi:hypothetical protein
MLPVNARWWVLADNTLAVGPRAQLELVANPVPPANPHPDPGLALTGPPPMGLVCDTCAREGVAAALGRRGGGRELKELLVSLAR